MTAFSSGDHVVGHVDGFVVDLDDSIAKVILERSRLWGQREVTISMLDVDCFSSDRIRLRLTRNEVRALPSAAFHHHASGPGPSPVSS